METLYLLSEDRRIVEGACSEALRRSPLCLGANNSIQQQKELDETRTFHDSSAISRGAMAKIMCSKLCAASAAAGAVAVILLGCAATPNENIGPRPTAYREIVRDHIRTSFADPYSIRDAQITEPNKVGQLTKKGTLTYETGWAVCVRANAKNRMGAYTGARSTVFLIRDGRVVESGDDTPVALTEKGVLTITPIYIKEHCESAKFEPFSELEEQPRQVGPRPR